MRLHSLPAARQAALLVPAAKWWGAWRALLALTLLLPAHTCCECRRYCAYVVGPKVAKFRAKWRQYLRTAQVA